MDNVTHALAGALIAAATVAMVERRTTVAVSPSDAARFRATAFFVGVLTAELPDADLLYAGPMLGIGNLGYLLHHRGHTHTIVFALLGALLVWGATLLLRKGIRASPWQWPMLALATVGALSHLLLDFTNSYGVHPFWPVDNRWIYGDAVFIVEPWLWVAALPPLMMIAVRRGTRVVLCVLLLAIVAATWTISIVGRDVAVAVTMASVLWLVAARMMRADRRAVFGIGAWLCVETMFFVASAAARGEVHAATSERARRDVVLTPIVGNPLCFSAIVVELDGPMYRSTSATVAAFPAIRDVRGCERSRRTTLFPEPADSLRPRDFTPIVGRDARRTEGRVGTPSVQWHEGWEAPHAELVGIVSTRCEVRAAMRFIRVPQWSGVRGDSIRIFDRRFGSQDFTTVTTPAVGGNCPSNVPGWVPPRIDILGDAALRP